MPIPIRIQVQSDPAAPQTSPTASEPMEALLFDISEVGIGLLAKNSLPWGTLVTLELSRSALPLSDRNSCQGLMRITGRVIHAIPHMGQYRLGISFIRLDDADRLLVQQLGFPQPLRDDRRRAPRIHLLEQST